MSCVGLILLVCVFILILPSVRLKIRGAVPSCVPHPHRPDHGGATSWKSGEEVGICATIDVSDTGTGGEREDRRSNGPRIDLGPPSEGIPAQAVGGVSQVVGRGTQTVVTASTLLLGTDSCVWTARGLGPSVLGSSAKLGFENRGAPAALVRPC